MNVLNAIIMDITGIDKSLKQKKNKFLKIFVKFLAIFFNLINC